MKKIVTVVSVFLMLACLVLTGCSTQDQAQTFEKDGMTITLTDQFTEKDYASYTVCYESSESLVVALKESFTLFEQVGVSTDISLVEYGELVMSSNNFEATIEETENITYFTYEKQVNGEDYTYMATLHRGADAYWLIQFACETKNFEKLQSQFIDWAKTITV
ncbi:MAG: hypothetical protein ACRDBM_13105 [Sporomusa sp.]